MRQLILFIGILTLYILPAYSVKLPFLQLQSPQVVKEDTNQNIKHVTFSGNDALRLFNRIADKKNLPLYISDYLIDSTTNLMKMSYHSTSLDRAILDPAADNKYFIISVDVEKKKVLNIIQLSIEGNVI